MSPTVPGKGRKKALEFVERLESSCCCLAVSRFGFPGLDARRYKALNLCLVLTCIGMAFDVVGFYGGYSQAHIGKGQLSWAIFRGPGFVRHAGVHWICQAPGADGTVRWDDGSDVPCRLLRSLTCSGSEIKVRLCNHCRKQAVGMASSLVIGVITYGLFLLNTYKRYIGRDRPFVKFMSCFASLVGGTNFLVAIVAFYSTCVRSVQLEQGDDVDSEVGLGWVFIVIGVVLQIMAGILHLGIPVTSSSEGTVKGASQSEEVKPEEGETVGSA